MRPINVIIYGAICDDIGGTIVIGIPVSFLCPTMVSKIIHKIFYYGIHLPFHFKNKISPFVYLLLQCLVK
jgi:hypothetical protein